MGVSPHPDLDHTGAQNCHFCQLSHLLCFKFYLQPRYFCGFTLLLLAVHGFKSHQLFLRKGQACKKLCDLQTAEWATQEVHHFLWNRGVINFRKYFGNIFVPPFADQKFYPPPPRATMIRKKYVGLTPMRVAWKICILELFHWTKFSLQFVATQ